MKPAVSPALASATGPQCAALKQRVAGARARQPAPREINARRCRRRGSCSPSVASHGARGSERSEGADFSSLPSIEERRGEPSRGRETHPTATIGVRGPSVETARRQLI